MAVSIEKMNTYFDSMLSWYKHLHQYPEVSFKEVKTTAYIVEQLEKLGGFTLSYISPTGVIADIAGGKPGKRIALRADIDCLAMQETTDLPFKSTIDGCMHGCGHDSHTAVLLGIAAYLSEHKEELPGSYRLLFQPAEEEPPGGAIEYVKGGALNDVDYVLGQHVMPFLQSGTIGIRKGPMMASSDIFRIVVKGRGGHASQPHMTIDPIAIGTQIVTNLQQIHSRELDPMEQLVISTTKFHSGTAVNVIPDTAIIEGSVRTYKDEVRALADRRIQEIAKGIALAHGADVDTEYIYGYDPTVNTDTVVEVVQDVVREAYGEAALPELQPLMGAEDFSRYLRVKPGAFFFTGIYNEEKGCVHAIHNGGFKVDTEGMKQAAYVMLATAERLASK